MSTYGKKPRLTTGTRRLCVHQAHENTWLSKKLYHHTVDRLVKVRRTLDCTWIKFWCFFHLKCYIWDFLRMHMFKDILKYMWRAGEVSNSNKFSVIAAETFLFPLPFCNTAPTLEIRISFNGVERATQMKNTTLLKFLWLSLTMNFDIVNHYTWVYTTSPPLESAVFKANPYLSRG